MDIGLPTKSLSYTLAKIIFKPADLAVGIKDWTPLLGGAMVIF